jgi:aminocarboxymuconate-semialdehyde decarboxylase
VLAKGDGAQVQADAKLINDEFAEICAKHSDHFPGWVAQGALGSADAGVAEAERSIKNGALGVQIYTNVAGKPLDDPAFDPFFAAMEKLDKPIWLHPARGANFADYASEQKSKYEIWWALGWSYETGAAMARLVFSRIMDKYPKLKVITHHFGGVVPMLEGRIGPGWDQLGARTSDEDLTVLLKQLKKRPLDYFKHVFYADTATFSAKPAMDAGFDFYDLDKIVFASDCPFDPEKGTMYTRDTLRLIEERDMPKADKDMVWHGNLERITGVTFKK